MRLIVEDPSVVVREYVLPVREDSGGEFVITYTALAVLHQLGIDLQKFHSAHTRDAALVTCEMMTAGLTQMEVMKSYVVGLADFLCLIDLEITALLNTLKQMLQYRFYAVITPTVTRHIIEVYDVVEDEKNR